MNFLERIYNTKKVQRVRELAKITLKKAKKKAFSLGKKADKELEISEKIEDAKEKINTIDNNLEISEKVKGAKEKVSDIAEKVGDKLESVLDNKISFKTFSKVEIKVGEILEAENIEKSEKLLKLTVSFGNETRQIISGIKKSYSAEEIKGKKAVFVTNLEPRIIMGIESEGMILGVSDGDNFSILSPDKNNIEAGAKAS